MLNAGTLMRCVPDPVTYCPPRPFVICLDCCISEECVTIEPNLVLKQGTVLWYDATTSTWKPLAAALPAVFPAGIKWGLLKNSVDTTVDCGCTTIVTHEGKYIEPRVQWPTGITAANKQRVKDELWKQLLKPVPYVA